MTDFVRLNPVSESILKVLLKHSRANPDNLHFALECDKVKIGDYLRSLMVQGYVVNTNHEHAGEVHHSDEYKITVEGENYLSSVNFYSVREKRQHYINIVTGTTALVALIKAFWNELSATILR